ncbi:hypothetical protein MNBD_GAMMA24-2824 [hydrothermal vent metagenome]|uniref:Uncharacterized protein n=1 Tax=hydrothermal vent metagenome TaxID=652676 RepID=A0A3B1BM35_9ZZZZ
MVIPHPVIVCLCKTHPLRKINLSPFSPLRLPGGIGVVPRVVGEVGLIRAVRVHHVYLLVEYLDAVALAHKGYLLRRRFHLSELQA